MTGCFWPLCKVSNYAELVTPSQVKPHATINFFTRLPYIITSFRKSIRRTGQVRMGTCFSCPRGLCATMYDGCEDKKCRKMVGKKSCPPTSLFYLLLISYLKHTRVEESPCNNQLHALCVWRFAGAKPPYWLRVVD